MATPDTGLPSAFDTYSAEEEATALANPKAPRTTADFWDPGAIGAALPPSPMGVLDVLRSSNVGNVLTQALGIGEPASPVRDTPGIDSLVPVGTESLDGMSPWDSVYVDGIRLPGIAKVEGLRKHKADAPTTPGAIGTSPIGLGYDPGEVTITLTLWTPQQFFALNSCLTLIQPTVVKGGYKPRAVHFDHPALRLLNIKTLYVLQLSLPRHVGKQIFEMTIQCIEFMPRALVVPKPYKADDISKGQKGSGASATPSPSQNPAVTGP